MYTTIDSQHIILLPNQLTDSRKIINFKVKFILKNSRTEQIIKYHMPNNYLQRYKTLLLTHFNLY